MKKFLYSVAFIFVVTFLAIWMNAKMNEHLMFASSSNPAYKMHRLFIQCPQVEIGIYGSSRANLHYIPTKFSSKTFNYGINGSGMNETLFHIKQAIKNKCDLPIIVNIDPWGNFSKDHSRPFWADYRLALENEDLKRALPINYPTFSECVPGVRFHGALQKNMTYFFDDKVFPSKEVTKGATLEVKGHTQEEWQNINTWVYALDFYFDEDYEKELTSIYNSTKRPIILVVGPISFGWRKRFKDEKKLYAFLEEQDKYENVYVFDLYTTTADWTDEYFSDATHLNKKGAIRFSNELAKQLKAHKDLKQYFE